MECPNPDCGEGTFMANLSDRHCCGKCGLALVKKTPPPPTAPPPTATDSATATATASTSANAE